MMKIYSWQSAEMNLHDEDRSVSLWNEAVTRDGRREGCYEIILFSNMSELINTTVVYRWHWNNNDLEINKLICCFCSIIQRANQKAVHQNSSSSTFPRSLWAAECPGQRWAGATDWRSWSVRSRCWTARTTPARWRWVLMGYQIVSPILWVSDTCDGVMKSGLIKLLSHDCV